VRAKPTTYVWAEVRAQIAFSNLNAADVPTTKKPSLSKRLLIASNPGVQTALFHLHNLVLAEGHNMTGPAQCNV
jgi:hypothetical protein